MGFTKFRFVHDGVEAIEYLKGEGPYADRREYPFPAWLILDLKMPRKNGLEVLQWLDENEECRVVPTIMLSNSDMPGDIAKAYKSGVNAFFTKPMKLSQMVQTLSLINHFGSSPNDRRCISISNAIEPLAQPSQESRPSRQRYLSIKPNISRTARSKPTNTARLMMLWPMFSSTMCGTAKSTSVFL